MRRYKLAPNGQNFPKLHLA